MATLAKRPLASWEPFTLRVDKEVMLTFLRRMLVAKAPQIRDLELSGSGDRLLLRLSLRLGPVCFKAEVELEELRLKGGFFGCRLRSLRGPLHLAVPSILLRTLFRRLPLETTWDPSERVLLVDLRPILPGGLDVNVQDVELANGILAISLGEGFLAPPLPQMERSEEEPPLGV